ncbi:MAG: RNA polymerase sigma factor [Opitutaceae bacterium]|nr:RNA polymerase sigma factor [Opitutaceae bacterium]
MNATKFTSGPTVDDAELVQETLDGNRDAYRQIVARYQSLICSVAYSGTGSVSRSEDIAQETFVTAWKRLCDLRDRASLRSWLCGIARNLVSNSRRRAIREPLEIAEPLDPAHEVASLERSPPEQVMRQEEEAILWRAVGSIPENYREPLILYYREHRSVEQVANKLGLTEDATKQRLLRGRALLQDQVLAFIEGSLERTRPGVGFTTAVMSALPILAPSLAATVGVSTAKGSSAAKAGSAGAGAGFTAAILGFVALLGGYVGWQMSASDIQSETERDWSARFWRFAVVGIAAFIIPIFILLLVWGRSHDWLRGTLSFYLVGAYIFVGVPLAIWAWENHKRIHGRSAEPQSVRRSMKLIGASLGFTVLAIFGFLRFGFPSGYWTDLWLEICFYLAVMALAVWVWDCSQRHRRMPEPSGEIARKPRKPPSLLWVAAATLCMAALLVVSVGGGWRTRVPTKVPREIIAQHPGAKIEVWEYENGTRSISIFVTVDGKVTRYVSRIDDATLASLNRDGVSYKTLRQGRDSEVLGAPGRLLFVVSLFAVVAGIVILVRGLQKRRGVRQTV